MYQNLHTNLRNTSCTGDLNFQPSIGGNIDFNIIIKTILLVIIRILLMIIAVIKFVTRKFLLLNGSSL